ncbi:regulatory associated protein of mTOR [Fistulifera solaris]|uniref:Regulatory associated protein of mTOR n=1 Tax=Fistulifera solaris TaxID=1519565 RepID=A0A1Z5JGL7_FISSO|nr:regulatory associated protein of mTOR [Fistulifera solaris]|eukprot:GAX13032.1 regulatory associated protein of mTOR [Fistulifera solaris]
MTNRKIYYGLEAPYLVSKSTTVKKQGDNGEAPQEADAAAGGNSVRVASVHRQISAAGESALGRSPSMLWRNRSRKSLQGTESESDDANGSHPSPDRKASDSQQEDQEPSAQSITPDWRLRDRMKTVSVGLVLSLNVGTDPPDIVKPHPCAVLQCWMNPLTVSRSKAKELIGERLEQQYAKWQFAKSTGNAANRQSRHRRTIDPTVEEVRNLCLSMRRQARNERVLLHYNGHGVPRPTDHGEIWVFDNMHTEYIPLPITDVRLWIGKPAIVVLDCSAAGILLPYLTKSLTEELPPGSRDSNPGGVASEDTANLWVKDTIVLAPCDAKEILPMDPAYPADIFTSCLTTPIYMALHWFLRRTPMTGLDPSMVEKIPGKAGDRKTPLGELNWIFTAVTDSIAWNVLPKHLFQRLFRQDLLVASLFRNFLLADRILRHLGCTPVSYPALPPTADHPLWQAWDLACETLLFQLVSEGFFDNVATASGTEESENEPTIGPKDPVATESPPQQECLSVTSPFFAEQLTAFEIWLDFAAIHKVNLASGKLQQSPEQLPVVLQVLLSQMHRIRALTLLKRFLDLGPWAVNLSLSLGIFPYVMKLLQSPEYKSLLVSIWASILAFDPSCRVDLLKDGAFHHFIQHLMWGLKSEGAVNVTEAARERTLAAYILAVACHEYPAGQAESARLNLHGTCCALLSSYEQGEQNQTDDTVEKHLPAHFRLWLVLSLASALVDNSGVQAEAYAAGAHQRLAARMSDQNTQVRAAVCYALGSLIGRTSKGSPSRSSSMHDIAGFVRQQMGGQSSTLVPAQHLPNVMMQNPATGTGGLQSPFMQGIPSNLSLAQSQRHQGHHLVHPGSAARQPALNIPSSHITPPVPTFWNPAMPTMRADGQQQAFIMPIGTTHSQAPHASFLPLDPIPFQPSPLSMDTPLRNKPSMYEDTQRLELDLFAMDKLIVGTHDSCVLVRYEAVIGLSSCVAKYLECFIAIAASSMPDQGANTEYLDTDTVDRFRPAWTRLRAIQKDELHPRVLRAAKSIISVVHENLLYPGDYEVDGNRKARRKSDLQTNHTLADQLASVLANIDEENEADTRLDTGESKSRPMPTRQTSDLRRVSSETMHSDVGISSLPSNFGSQPQKVDNEGERLSYSLPRSNFFQWQIASFDHTFSGQAENNEDIDPLSPEGATRLYHERRVLAITENARRMADHYSALAPKPPKAEKRGIELILQDDDEDAVGAVDEEVNVKKRELAFKEVHMLRNEGVKMTSMLSFHPFEDFLVSCDSSDQIATWDTNSGRRSLAFSNENPDGTRITSCCWINEKTSKSMVLVGTDDGAVRLWGGMIDEIGIPTGTTSLVTAFSALPMSLPVSSGSGLVCEWQPEKGRLITAGSSQILRSWDVESEQISVELETHTTSHITTLTSAYDPFMSSPSGLGPDIIVAGLSDGALRIYDIRSRRTAQELLSGHGSRGSKRTGARATLYSEHKSWVVRTAFTNYANKSEIVSGTLAGEIKFWDLRMSSSIRTIEGQRSTMTTLAVHPHIPMLATGSHAQFIKMLTPDGDTLQVLRYHEKMANHRIGPVSFVAFHPFKPLLAAGATDSMIGLYAPIKKLF